MNRQQELFFSHQFDTPLDFLLNILLLFDIH
jgi:hypothetical protein